MIDSGGERVSGEAIMEESVTRIACSVEHKRQGKTKSVAAQTGCRAHIRSPRFNRLQKRFRNIRRSYSY